ncbi:hypothetical protein SteCoe_20164 [Stentor coeruleus]|uniref:Uncharacterized protein n=1 Tax=Stentor coeruleus TaxID=5963 RepID=A0A1R2BSU6_9CILI|nr:hypothetical protein SteCoe_20164 [Stentor coeruleus]
MGCGGSKDDVKQISISTKKPEDEEKPITAKQQAINNIFSKTPETLNEDLLKQPSIKPEIVMPKLNLKKRDGPIKKNVNLLIEDNTKVWDMS